MRETYRDEKRKRETEKELTKEEAPGPYFKTEGIETGKKLFFSIRLKRMN